MRVMVGTFARRLVIVLLAIGLLLGATALGTLSMLGGHEDGLRLRLLVGVVGSRAIGLLLGTLAIRLMVALLRLLVGTMASRLMIILVSIWLVVVCLAVLATPTAGVLFGQEDSMVALVRVMVCDGGLMVGMLAISLLLGTLARRRLVALLRLLVGTVARRLVIVLL